MKYVARVKTLSEAFSSVKHILSVQDLSCAGRCSQTVALPVLSVMGHRCSVLPTAILSTHTAFPQPVVYPVDMAAICHHWEQIPMEFDAVLVGYLADPTSCETVEKLLKKQDGLKILDPAMGDNGKLYSGITHAHVTAMGNLCRSADILLPNVTEAAMLAGLPYQNTADADYYRRLADTLLETFGVRGVVITGASLAEGQTGFYCRCRKEEKLYQVTKLAKTLHGTGDLFSAVLSGSLLKGKTLPQAAEAAAQFVEKAIAATEAVTPHGVEFERVLKDLL